MIINWQNLLHVEKRDDVLYPCLKEFVTALQVIGIYIDVHIKKALSLTRFAY